MLPNKFVISSENVIASYDSTDIAEGTGIVEFQCFTTNQDTSGGANTPADAFRLSSNAQYTTSTSSGIAFTSSSSTYANTLTENFDLAPFNLPKIIKGSGRFILVNGMNKTAGTQGAQGYLEISLVKVDLAAAETIIGTAYSAPVTDTNANGVYVTQFANMVFTCTQTHFKIGETLRVKVKFWTRSNTNTVSDSGTFTIAHDPQNNTIANFNTPSTSFQPNKFLVEVPFRIDL